MEVLVPNMASTIAESWICLKCTKISLGFFTGMTSTSAVPASAVPKAARVSFVGADLPQPEKVASQNARPSVAKNVLRVCSVVMLMNGQDSRW